MRRFLPHLMLACLTWASALAAPSTNGEEGLPFGTWSVPLALASRPDPLSPDGKRIPRIGFKIREGSNELDATDFLSAMGVTFPPGSETIYSQDHGQLIVRNTAENLGLIDRVLVHCRIGSLHSIPTVELSIFECELPEAKHPTSRVAPTIQDLRNLPAEKIRLIDRVSSASKSGQRIQISRLSSPAGISDEKSDEDEEDPEDSNRFREGEYGIVADWEPIIGPDNSVIDNSIEFRWRGGPASENSREIAMQTFFTTWDGYPRILHTSSIPDSPGKYLVVTGVVRISVPKEFTIDDLKAAVAKVKAIEEENKRRQSQTTLDPK